ncbi:autophagy-related protein 2-like, partial [Magnolia sinica]|uniref:autophagy-related protein 2-like n=1 Tax=Magnolia sinica TaxID=86752 RepID=UPI00265800AF
QALTKQNQIHKKSFHLFGRVSYLPSCLLFYLFTLSLHENSKINFNLNPKIPFKFRWNIAKSTEAMFSRWAIKHVCKFLLKKKLGKFILGDLDLDHLDVQLSKGTIQLTDLALDVDYINQKLGVAPVIVKEGSIGSLIVTIPWKVKSCQIEVEELELVLAPRVGSNLPADTDELLLDRDGKKSVSNGLEKVESEMDHGSAASVSPDVHEGVKTIAKMVKWLLTSFHVKIKNLIFAFDPCSEKYEKRSKPQRLLVLRIPETEYGTCVSEEASPISDSGADSFLGMSRLTTFVKFRGAIIDLLQMDNVGNQSPHTTASGTAFNEKYTGSLPSGTTPILTGEIGGFSGMLKLSMPWKNGSLDIRKVDADVSIDPMQLRLQPSTINWIICLWECLKNAGMDECPKNVGMDERSNLHHRATDSALLNSTSCYQSFTLATGRVTPSSEKFSSGFCSPTGQETATDALLPGTHVIPHWVPFSINKDPKDGTEAENYGASIDQFFECFDGMRSSQSALGTSGIWNWTSSVFSAITAASSLASGSVHISSKQQHVETNLRATVVGFSVVLSFYDEHQEQSQDSKGGNRNIGDLDELKYESYSISNTAIRSLNGLNPGSAMPTFSSMNVEQSTTTEFISFGQNVHYLEAKFWDLVLTLQVCPQKMKFEAMINCIEVDDCFDNGNKAVDVGFSNCEHTSQSQMLLVQNLQAQVQDALPPFPFSAQDPDSEPTNGSSTAEDPLCKSSTVIAQGVNNRTACKAAIVKVKLLKSHSERGCQVAVNTTSLDDGSRASTSFSVKLPPFILWVNFNLVNLLLDLSKKVGHYSETTNRNKDFRSEVFGKKHDFSCHRGIKTGTCTCVKNVSPSGSVQGDIVVSRTRVVLCFPYESHGDFRHCSSWEEFVCLDFSPSSSMKPIPHTSSQKGYSDTRSSSINLNFGDLNVYLITSDSKSAGNNYSTIDRRTFSAEKILSAIQETDDYSIIRMSWQGGPVTGPWIKRKAWHLATSQDSRSRNKVMGKGYDFASVTTAEDLWETNSCMRQEMILSSAFVLHICLSLVWIHLGSSEYKLLDRLLHQVLDGFAHVAHDTEASLDDSVEIERASPGDGNSSQVSVLVECDAVDLFISLEKGADIKCLIQKELPGTWDVLRLTVAKFGLFSVSSIGGVSGANYVWVSHVEGELRGCLSGMVNEASVGGQDLLLISCKNSTMRRGGGEGTNTLLSGSAGTNIIHMWDPQLLQSFTSITVRCGTIIAPGGRLDWLNEICHFFSLPSHVNEQAGGHNVHKESSEDHVACASSFFLDLVDIALSYEPHITNSVTDDGVLEFECDSSAKPVEESGEQCVACLLAAASLHLSNKSLASSTFNEFKIRLQDIGLLISASSWSDNDEGTYSVEYLRKSGYVKVAGETLVEAILRTNCNSGLLWELECSECHIHLDTCHDTTAGLIRLVGQLQQLFAPDIEESVAHLQTRWDTVQQVHGRDYTTAVQVVDSCSVSPILSGQTSNRGVESRSMVVGLMDEIYEDAFYRNHTCPSGSCEVQSHIAVEGCLPRQVHNLNSTPTSSDAFPLNSFMRPVCGVALEKFQSSSPAEGAYLPEFIEGYCTTELLPPPQSSVNIHSLNEVDLKCKYHNSARVDLESGKGGWYKDSSLQIIENHVSKVSEHDAGEQIHEESELPSVSSITPAESCKPSAQILLKNIDVRWRMYAGSDWPNSRKKVPPALNTGGRDTTICLEVALSGMNIQYDMFPDGEIHVSNLSLSVQDFNLYDSSRDAPWKMVLGYYHSKDHPRESCAKAFKLDLEAVRPDPLIPLEEYRLRVAFLPIRLHLDQSQLDFLISFFACKDSSINQSRNLSSDLSESRVLSTKNCILGRQPIAQEALLPFFQGIELQLKHVHAVGIYGWGNVCETIVGEWLEDISHNQVHKLLKGLAPIRSLFAVGSGAAKLVSWPVKSYRKDHRLLKGMQRGAVAFLRSISIEAVGLGLHLAAGAHNILHQTETILTSIPPSVPLTVRSGGRMSVRSNPPKDAQQGIKQAYESLSEGLGKTASALVGNPIKAYQRGAGVGSALASAVRAAPAAAIAPASAAAQAFHCAFLGVRNSIDPEHKKESMEKYLGPSQPRACRK